MGYEFQFLIPIWKKNGSTTVTFIIFTHFNPQHLEVKKQTVKVNIPTNQA